MLIDKILMLESEQNAPKNAAILAASADKDAKLTALVRAADAFEAVIITDAPADIDKQEETAGAIVDLARFIAATNTPLNADHVSQAEDLVSKIYTGITANITTAVRILFNAAFEYIVSSQNWRATVDSNTATVFPSGN